MTPINQIKFAIKTYRGGSFSVRQIKRLTGLSLLEVKNCIYQLLSSEEIIHFNVPKNDQNPSGIRYQELKIKQFNYYSVTDHLFLK